MIITNELSDHEAAELAELEREAREAREAEALAARRQHLEALRMAKRLSAKHGKLGHDFLVLETTIGNIAIRRPVDVEIDTMAEVEDGDRGKLEEWCAGIALEPSAAELRVLMGQHHGLMGAIVGQATKLLRVLREEDQKK